MVTENPTLPPILGQESAQKKSKAPIRVLTLTPFFPSENDDAAGCFVSEPLAALDRAGVESAVFAVQPFYRRKMHPRQNAPAQWIRYPSIPRGFGLPSAGAFLFASILSRVRELQRADKIDVVHAHAALPCGHAAMLLKSELHLPYVVTVHGLDAFSTEQVHGRAGKWCRRISMRVYQSSRRVICISERVREQVLEGTGPTCRTSVVYNAVDPKMFSPEISPARASLLVLSVGNLIPIKGHEVLIRSIASLASQFKDLTLEIIGDGAERLRLENLAGSLGISQRVHFRGRQSRTQVAEAMRRCAVFCLPSRYEGLGCVYLEAMSSGKPVIACRGQGIAEIIRQGSNGFLVGPDNEKELSLALSMLLRDESLSNRIGKAARETVLDQFTLSEQAERLSRIYRESLA
jgi:teichuronic acid biosynthesis glycosyltransferase TuaC